MTHVHICKGEQITSCHRDCGDILLRMSRGPNPLRMCFMMTCRLEGENSVPPLPVCAAPHAQVIARSAKSSASCSDSPSLKSDESSFIAASDPRPYTYDDFRNGLNNKNCMQGYCDYQLHRPSRVCGLQKGLSARHFHRPLQQASHTQMV